jgi:hypothetical protein
MEPDWLKALAVRFGTRAILLPVFDDAPSPYEELERRAERDSDLSISWNCSFPWPTRPEHRFDVADPDEHSSIENFLVRACHKPTSDPIPDPAGKVVD